jgi:pilus assembly protein Flp/PilA
MLNQIKLRQAMIVGWVRSQTSDKDDTGASLVEYALLLALIAVVAIGALTFLGTSVTHTLNNVANAINNP